MGKNHTIEMLLSQGARRLQRSSGTPRLDAQLLLAHALGVSRGWLVAHAQDLLEAAPYADLIEQRAAGAPLAYILGFKDFWTLRLRVTPAVLVPRPETELLVERALALAQAPAAKVADLGTGSGAIALALASERPAWQITATDASAQALGVARSNALELNLTRVAFLQGSWFGPLAEQRFDLILSNPPYIAADDPALRDPALQCEPQMALCPGRDGMACLREIILTAPDFLSPRGWLLLEHGADQAAAVAHELVVRGYTHVRSHRDLAGHERVTEARVT